MKPKKPGNELPEKRGLYPETPTCHYITPSRPHQADLPTMPDDVALAHSMGVRLQTIWWLVMNNDYNDYGVSSDKHNMYNKIVIKKSDGSDRIIHEPKQPLKAIQQILLGKIFNKIECPEYFGAYVPNRSPVDMAKRHVGYKYKLSVDLKDFFHWVHRNEIRDWLVDVGYPRVVRDILGTLTTVPMKKPHLDYPLYVLPQGGPTSGAIANHVADQAIDTPVIERLEKLFGAENFVYSRYSDNIEISFTPLAKPMTMGVDKFQDFVVDNIRKIANESNFWLNDDKTKLREKNKDPMKVLGIMVNEKLNIPSHEREKLRAMAHNAKYEGLDEQAEKAGLDDGRAFYDMLQSKLAYWAQVRPEKVKPWQEKLEDAFERYTS